MNKKVWIWGIAIAGLGVAAAIYFNKKNVEKRKAKRMLSDKRIVPISETDSLIANPVLTEE